MKIAYISHILNIHDYRFLKKLSESQHRVWLITHYRGKQLPTNIRNLPNVEIIHGYFRSKWNPRRYMDRQALRLLAGHLLWRAYLGVTKRSPLVQKCVASRDWSQSDRWMIRMHAASGLRPYQCYHHLVGVLRHINPDLVHAGWVPADGLITALAGFHPFLLMPWGSDILLEPVKSAQSMARTRYTLGKADMITCDCESVKKRVIELSGYPAEKIVVIPRGVDLSLFNPKCRGNSVRQKLGWEGKKVLIMTRALAPGYGIEFFLQALPNVIKQEPNARALLIGSGPLDSKLHDMATRLGLSNDVYFTGFIPNEQLPQYLNAADVYVSTSLSDGTSLSLLEAMACGLPVVVADVPSYFEWVQEGANGFIVPRRDPDAVAERILLLLKNADLAKRMGNRSLAIAEERANWQKNFAKIEQIYFDLIAQNRKGFIPAVL